MAPYDRFYCIPFQTPTPSLSESERGKPIAEVKPEQLRPVSKSRMAFTVNRPERTQAKQPPQPIVLSQVSMQNSKTDEKSEDGSVKNSETDSNEKKKSKSDSSGINGIKVERSKSNLSGINKKTKYSGVKDTHSGDKRAIDQRPTLHKENSMLKDHSSSIPNRNMGRLVEDSLKQELIISSGDSLKVIDYNGVEVSKSHRTRNSSGKERHRGHHRDITKIKDKVLPKPSLPSQQYLEGMVPKHGEPAWSQRVAIPSPLSSKDGGLLSESNDLDWLNTVKR